MRSAAVLAITAAVTAGCPRLHGDGSPARPGYRDVDRDERACNADADTPARAGACMRAGTWLVGIGGVYEDAYSLPSYKSEDHRATDAELARGLALLERACGAGDKGGNATAGACLVLGDLARMGAAGDAATADEFYRRGCAGGLAGTNWGEIQPRTATVTLWPSRYSPYGFEGEIHGYVPDTQPITFVTHTSFSADWYLGQGVSAKAFGHFDPTGTTITGTVTVTPGNPAYGLPQTGTFTGTRTE